MRPHLFCEKVVHYTSSVLRFDSVEDALHAEGAKPGTEGEQHLVNARLVHGSEARRVEVQKALLHDLKILWPEMANGGLFSGLEPAVAISHEHYGVAEVLLKRDFAQGCRGRRCAEFGQTGNSHRVSPLRVTVPWCLSAGMIHPRPLRHEIAFSLPEIPPWREDPARVRCHCTCSLPLRKRR